MYISNKWFRAIRPGVCVMAVAILVLLSLCDIDQNMARAFSIGDVRIDQGVITPGEQVGISFFLSEPAVVTVQIYSPDYDVVRSLIQNQTRASGINTVYWDGRDDENIQVPDEGYLVAIRARGEDGLQAVYDPTAHSGGEITEVRLERVSPSGSGYKIFYSVPFASRISLKAGIHNGPLLKTLIDWQPATAGEHVQVWDGLDETGRIQVMEQPGAHLHFEGYVLPNNTIIVQSSSSDYLVYRRGLKSDLNNIISFQTARRSSLNRMAKGISAQNLVKRSANVSPVFTVYLEDDRVTPLADKPAVDLSGQARLVVVVAPESMALFNESRYEIIVFVDNMRFDEEEHAHTPYTYTLDTRKLSNGEHLITINQACITGQIGAYSFKINVKN